MSDPITGQGDEEVRGMAAETHVGTSAIAYLLAGPLTFGGLGWVADTLWNTSFLMVTGAIIGVGLSIYVVWLRYGRA